jgi:hypothetical protein
MGFSPCGEGYGEGDVDRVMVREWHSVLNRAKSEAEAEEYLQYLLF